METEVQDVETTSEVPAVTEAAKEVSAAEEAAMQFTQLLPYVKKIASAADGKKSLVRVMHALAEFPLGASVPRLLNNNERQLFQIMQELNGYKSTVLQEIIKNRVPPAATEGSVNE